MGGTWDAGVRGMGTLIWPASTQGEQEMCQENSEGGRVLLCTTDLPPTHTHTPHSAHPSTPLPNLDVPTWTWTRVPINDFCGLLLEASSILDPHSDLCDL